VPFQIALVGYVGLVAGDLVAVKLLAGWARTGIPWSTAPGIVLLVAAALVVPWGTGKPFYCHHVCPHGAAQELLGRIRPRRWQVTLSAGAVRGLEYLPFALLGADSDNGGEFIKHHLVQHFSQRQKPVLFTRSRPYHKNDNAPWEKLASPELKALKSEINKRM
jgi:hypothetical protein